MNTASKTFLLLLSAALLGACSQSPEEPTAGQRADELIERLSLEQKASLLMHASAPIPELGIPAYNWWNEALHGVGRNGSATVFPMPIGMAASFDEPLLEEVFSAVSDEARIKNRQARERGVVGNYQGLSFWTPNINIFRDPRWGRGMETYGEDPFLTAKMGSAVVRGLQGDGSAKVLKTNACAKHFAVHSGPEWNRHSFDARVSERELRETYLPAFKELVTRAGVREVMIAYNRFRGVPCGASTYLVDTILRKEWGFEGLVVSDCWAVHDFYVPGRHDYSPDAAHAVAEALECGVDMECGDSYRHIPEAVRQGLLKESTVDRSLRRVLAERIRLGELDGIDPWSGLDTTLVEGPGHKALSLKMARESLVLLQNRGGLLPLKPGARIALTGPNADDEEMMWGNYNPVPDSTVTLFEGMRRIFPNLTYIPGCEAALDGISAEALLQELGDIDTVVFAGGINPRLEGEQMQVDIPGFRGGDRTSIELPQVQRDILRALRDAGKTVVLVNFSGSAVGLEPETESCGSILQAWYPGQEGGTAVAEVLAGRVAPSGKLPVTFYRSTDDLPPYEDYSMQGRTYRFFEGEPLFPFGFGLSYTAFEYGEPAVRGGRLTVKLTNKGSREGTETVQLYVRRPGDDWPRLTLRGFRRVSLAAGESAKVHFRLDDEVFSWWDGSEVRPLEGEWELLVGGSSDALKCCRTVRR